MTVTIKVPAEGSGFAEDKDLAKSIRETQILPALQDENPIVLDFAAVHYATQSFVHALIGEALRRLEDRALDQIEFRNCTPSVRSVIELVVDYSLAGFPETEAV